MAMRHVLTVEGLEHVSAHKYKGGVASPVEVLLNGWWQRLTELLPLWLAPNLVTLAGLAPLVLCYVLCWCYSPDAVTPVPSWLTFVQSLALLFYQTLDNMDGKQARRIGLSTPMGQLFDHGCDCLACLSHHSIATSFLCPGGSRWGVASLSVFQMGFFMAQWQERYTGVLVVTFGPVGVAETQCALMAAGLLASYAGPEATSRLFAGELALPWWSSTTLRFLALQGWVAFNLVLQSIALGNVVKASLWGSPHCTDQEVCMSQFGRPGGRRLLRAVLDLVSIAVLTAAAVFWRPSLLIRNPRLYHYLHGMLAFKYSTKMILFTMARQTYPVLQPSLLLYVACVGVSRYISPSQEEAFHHAMTAFAVGLSVYVSWWLFSAIQQLKAKLGIFILFTGKFDARTKSQ